MQDEREDGLPQICVKKSVRSAFFIGKRAPFATTDNNS
ncbi:Hypothetical protein ABZS17D1_00758 [Kosakonia cowanii]